MNRFVIMAGLATFSNFTLADNSPWIQEPGTFTISITQTAQSADEFYVADLKNSLPEDLEQSTTWLSANYGLSDSLALDLKTGYARSTFDASPQSHFSGRTDSNLGITWRFIDEFVSNSGLPSTSIRLGATLQGNYETGAINAIGDGADSVEASIASGKFLMPWFAVQGEIGYRSRSSETPDEAFYKVGAYLLPLPGLTISAGYTYTDAEDGLQLNDPAFAPSLFPLLEEDVELVDIGLSYALADHWQLGLSGAQVVDGRNTARSEAYALTVSFTN